jgi:segregation and condensation protein B
MSEKPDVNDESEIATDVTAAASVPADAAGHAPEAPVEGARADIAEAIDALVMGDVDDDEVHDAAAADDAAVIEAAADEDAVVPPPDDQLIAIVEALIFASPDPVTLKALTKLLEPEAVSRIEAAIEVLKARYNDQRGLTVVEVANGYQIVTRPELHEWVRRLFHERTTQKLSVAALETLAVIAYKQPVTAAEIAEIRSVNTSGVLGTLIDRKLIKIAGRKAVVGRPFMYATTREFLERFGLRDLNDLPKIEDMADVLGFDPPLLDDTAVATALPFDGAVDASLAPADLAGDAAPGETDGDAAPAPDDTAGAGDHDA